MTVPDSSAQAARPEAGLGGIIEVMSMLLAGAEEETVLQHVTDVSHRATEGAGAALILPSVGDDWAVEFTSGDVAEGLLGTLITGASPLGQAIDRGRSGHVESLAVVLPNCPEEAGAALYAPMTVENRASGLLLVLNPADGPDFTERDLAIARTFASQAALALDLAEARTSADRSELLQERQRIARDLHDLAIQQLFAVGVQLEQVAKKSKRMGDEGRQIAKSLNSSISGVELAVSQIREIVQSLRAERDEVALSERLQHEAALSTGGLGFRPSLRLDSALDDVVGDPELADDLVAVVREGLANAAKHAQASAVSVTVTAAVSAEEGRHLLANVTDNGRGISARNRRSSGLSNLRARARRHNGWAEILQLEPGTMISWRVPLDRDEAAGAA